MHSYYGSPRLKHGVPTLVLVNFYNYVFHCAFFAENEVGKVLGAQFILDVISQRRYDAHCTIALSYIHRVGSIGKLRLFCLPHEFEARWVIVQTTPSHGF